MFDWRGIEQVMLDMDGTLLDLHFDNHFWQQHLPCRLAELQGRAGDDARTHVAQRLRSAEGSLSWYCTDHWSREFQLDIGALKQEVAHLIAVHAHVEPFLHDVRASGRTLWLVTNAHADVLKLKLARTDLQRHFDAVVCSHDLGLPKEDPRFWETLASRQPFARENTLLVDDSLPVLRSARVAGLARLLAVSRPDSRAESRDTAEFAAIEHFGELTPVPPLRCQDDKTPGP